MRNVALPDSTYEEAARSAAARGQSVEDFVAQLVRLDVEDEAPLVLTPEQIEKVRRAQESVRVGRVFTSEQLKESLAARRAGWIEANAR